MRYRFAHASAIAFLVLATEVASAQESATIDISADIVAAQPALSIAPETGVVFGTVNIPDGSRGDNVCRYDIAAEPADSRELVREIDTFAAAEPRFPPAASIIANGAPTPSRCDRFGERRPATFTVQCEPGRTLNLVTSATDTPGDGMVFQITGVFWVVGDGRYVVPPFRTDSCPASGTETYSAGGNLVIGPDAQPGPATAGTLTLTVDYN